MKKLSKRGIKYTQTTPEGAEIPVPKRKDVLRDLKKAATTSTDQGSDSNDRPKSQLRDG